MSDGGTPPRPDRAETAQDPGELVPLPLTRGHERRELHEDRPELVAERAAGLEQRVDDRIAQFTAGLRIRPLESSSAGRCEAGRETPRVARMPGDHLVRFDVEAEFRRGALRPCGDGLDRRERVELALTSTIGNRAA